ncbi:MAG TPA: UDP-N-acetylmuramoyl-tripeptide--D-alanyl-D-alanine ligase, partial [Flavisolibacter sp.]
PFLAITGSNGKTTTKELVHAVLSTSYTTYTTSGNLNNHIGVPLTILGIRGDAQIAVIEMGANHLGEIAFYCRIALPTHGLITNCGKAHLEGFGSEEGVRKGKGELFDFLRENGGTAFIMKDYDYLRSMSRGIPQIITYGTSEADVTGDIISADPFLSVTFTSGFNGIVNSHLVGTYNLPNVLAAVCAGKHFTVDDEKIRSAIASYLPSNSRSQLVEKGSNRIILDAYNANPSSMKVAIENFSKAEGANKILVLGAMAELGADSPAEHAALVEQIRKTPWKEVILVGDDFKNVAGGFHHFKTSEDAGRWMKDRVRNAFLLVKGSRSMRMEKVLEFI